MSVSPFDTLSQGAKQLLAFFDEKLSSYPQYQKLSKYPEFWPIVGTSLLVICTILFFLFGAPKPKDSSGKMGKTKKKKKGEVTVLLIGPTGSGKTSIFNTLVHSSRPQTHSSLATSTGSITVSPPASKTSHSSRKVTLIDMPGHPRLISSVKEKVKNADAVIFVCDIGGVGKDIGKAVDALLPVLPPSATVPSSLLLVAHKLDTLPTPSSKSLAIPRLHTALTKELSSRRSSGLSSIETPGSSPKNEEDESGGAGVGSGGRWRWDVVKGVSWAGSWVGVNDMAASLSSSKPQPKQLSEKEEEEMVEKGERGPMVKAALGAVDEDGLVELKEWLWELD